MLAKLFGTDHGKKTGTGPACGDHVEWRRSLADLLAIGAGELLADVLAHPPGFWDHLQCLGDPPRASTVAKHYSKRMLSVAAPSGVRGANAPGTVDVTAACGQRRHPGF